MLCSAEGLVSHNRLAHGIAKATRGLSKHIYSNSRLSVTQVMPKLVFEDLDDEDKQSLLDQAMILCQPTGGSYYKLYHEEQTFSVEFTIIYLHPLAKFGTIEDNLPSINMTCPPLRPIKSTSNPRITKQFIGLAKNSTKTKV